MKNENTHQELKDTNRNLEKDNLEDGKKTEKSMVPFFESDTTDFDFSLKNQRTQYPRRLRHQKSENFHHRGKNLYPNKNFNQPQPKREIGLNSKPLRENQHNLKPSSPNLRGNKGKNDLEDFYEDSTGQRITYIDKSNVGNIRPIDKLYNKNNPKEDNTQLRDLAKYTQEDLRPSFRYQVNYPIQEQGSFVDALIKSTNSIEDVVLDESNDKLDRTKELKSVLKKMGILDKSNAKKVDKVLKDKEKEVEKLYVFPKYMSSPDPSSLPIPGSL